MSHDDKLPLAGSRPTTGPFDFESCIVEVAGEAVGLLTVEDVGLVFHAASKEAWPLECCVFASRQGAERAVRQLLGVSRKTLSEADYPRHPSHRRKSSPDRDSQPYRNATSHTRPATGDGDGLDRAEPGESTGVTGA